MLGPVDMGDQHKLVLPSDTPEHLDTSHRHMDLGNDTRDIPRRLERIHEGRTFCKCDRHMVLAL